MKGSPSRKTERSRPVPETTASERVLAEIADRFHPYYYVLDLLSRPFERLERRYSARQVRTMWKRTLAGERAGREPRRVLQCYLHVPFCRQKCVFCPYHFHIVRRPKDAEAYLARILKMFQYFAPVFAGHRFHGLFVGGGTPSALSADQLERLLGAFTTAFDFSRDGEMTFEASPDTFTEEKLEIVRRHGFNKITLGVQSLDPAILARENRPHQTAEQTVRLIKRILEAGLFLNIDMLRGMRGDTAENFFQSIRAVMALEPDTVTAYRINPARPYLNAFYGGDISAYFADFYRRYRGLRRLVREAAPGLGYSSECGIPEKEYVWRLNKKRRTRRSYRVSYDENQRLPMSLFGIGPSARGRIASRFIGAELIDDGPGFDPEAPAYKGVTVEPDDDLRKYVIVNIFRETPMARAEYRERFGIDLLDAFPRAFRRLRRSGEAEVSSDAVGFRFKDHRRRFLAALRFVFQEELDRIYVGSLVLRSKDRAVSLFLESARAEGEYLAEASGFGFGLRGDLVSVLPEEGYHAVRGLLLKLFARLAQARPRPSVRELTRRYRLELSALLAKLGKKGLLRGVRVAAGAAPIDRENIPGPSRPKRR